MNVPPNTPPQAPPRPPGPPLPPTGAGSARLVREPDERKIAGVCAGVADHLGVDVSVVRLVAVALAIFTPVGLIAYLVAWAVVPERRPDQPRVRAPRADLSAFHRVPRWILIAGGIALFVVLVDDDSWWWPDAPISALLLVGVGLWLLLRGGDDDERVGVDPPAPGPDAAPVTWSETVGTDTEMEDSNAHGDERTTVTGAFSVTPHTSEGAGPPGELPPPVPRRWSGTGYAEQPAVEAPREAPRQARRPSSQVGLAVVALLLIGGGLVWLLDVLDVATLSVGDGLAVGLLVIGLGLVVAAWRGRAWALVFLGLVLTSVLAFGEVLDVPFDAGIGDRTLVVDSRSELDRRHDLFAGTLVIDLTHAPLADARTTVVEAAVGMGELRVIVPRDANLDVEARVKAGNIAGDLAPTPDEGGVTLDESFSATGSESGPDLELDLQVGLGLVEVDRG
jgi:phage shock protein PspC (stress-responsive transcriptional regulator)